MPQIVRLIFRPRYASFFFPDIKFTQNFSDCIKRLIDILVSAPLLLICFILSPIFYFYVIYKSPGKFLYTQMRGGLGNKPFKIYKLRTLHTYCCDEGEQQVIHKDSRVTHHGKWLRYFSIDELPQLYNVLIGDMSLVGPRPHSVPMDDYYREYIPFYNERYKIKPGITGLAQIRGSRGEIKVIQDMEHRISLDIKYIRKQSVMRDIWILLKTAHMIFCKIC